MATQKIKVNVTQEYIDEGSHSAGSCPVALGLRQALKELGMTNEYVGVTSGYLDFWDGDNPSKSGQETYTISLPHAMTKWVWAYDAKHRVEPFSFEIDIYPDYEAEIAWNSLD